MNRIERADDGVLGDLDRLLTPDDVRDVLRHDLFYIEHWGMFMDLSIVAKTAAEFLFHRAP